MNGPQLRVWRKAHNLTLHEIAATTLDGEVSQSTLSRWEASTDEIPSWASAKLLGTTQITLALDELHELIDLAREQKISFDELLGDCIREHRLQEQHEASRLSPCCNSPLVNEGGAVRCMNYTAEVTPNAADQGAKETEYGRRK